VLETAVFRSHFNLEGVRAFATKSRTGLESQSSTGASAGSCLEGVNETKGLESAGDGGLLPGYWIL